MIVSILTGSGQGQGPGPADGDTHHPPGPGPGPRRPAARPSPLTPPVQRAACLCLANLIQDNPRQVGLLVTPLTSLEGLPVTPSHCLSVPLTWRVSIRTTRGTSPRDPLPLIHSTDSVPPFHLCLASLSQPSEPQSGQPEAGGSPKHQCFSNKLPSLQTTQRMYMQG